MNNRYKEDLEWFVTEMEVKLNQNNHKGTWKNDNICDLFLRLKEEVKELEDEFKKLDGDAGEAFFNMIGECADIANFSMMIAERAYEMAGK